MKSSFMRKITALFVAVMMLLPMAAQAEEAGSGYYEASVSDLIVNYMGTQLDFTGLTLKLLGGVDANNKNAIAGLTVGTPDDSKISIAAELGEKDATVLLANQLVTIPYDRMGDALAKLGAETDEEFSDLTPIMDSVWAEIAGAVAIGAIDSAEPDTDINFDTTAISELMSEVTADVTPTDAERTINEVTYAGTEAVVDMTAEQATPLIAGIITTVYGNEQVVAAMESIGEAFTSAAAQSGEDIGDVDFSAMYTAFVENAQKMTMPNGLKMTVFAATAEDGTSVTDIQIERGFKSRRRLGAGRCPTRAGFTKRRGQPLQSHRDCGRDHVADEQGAFAYACGAARGRGRAGSGLGCAGGAAAHDRQAPSARKAGRFA